MRRDDFAREFNHVMADARESAVACPDASDVCRSLRRNARNATHQRPRSAVISRAVWNFFKREMHRVFRRRGILLNGFSAPNGDAVSHRSAS
jgi:hypothetical protein